MRIGLDPDGRSSVRTIQPEQIGRVVQIVRFF